jgi:hypothetical protein
MENEPKTPEETPGPAPKTPDETITLGVVTGQKANGELDLKLRAASGENGNRQELFSVRTEPIDEPKPAQPAEPAVAAALESAVMKAFLSIGETMLGMRRQMEVTDGMLKEILAERAQLVDLVTRLSGQVQTFAKLQDSDHSAIEVLLMSQGTPKGRDVN